MRELGMGRWDRILKKRMLQLSESDDWDIAKEEWLATGDVWWSGNGDVPEWVASSTHPNYCLCGHGIVYHFRIVNTENGNEDIVGSDHINSYLIMRQIADEKKVEIGTVTEEEVQRWLKVRVGSMKAEAWWKANGELFETMFNKVKEVDTWMNVRVTDENWNYKTNMYDKVKVLRKKGKGTFGTEDYKMASIVWRWNHPDNPKNQFNVHGYPNDQLMRDLSFYYVTCDADIENMNKHKALVAERMEQYNQRMEEQARRREQQRLEREERERQRQIQWELDRPAREERERQQRIAREKWQAEQDRIHKEKEAQKLQSNEAYLAIVDADDDQFKNMCGFYDIPVFTETYASNEWETNFLADIKRKLSKGWELSRNQLNTLKNIFEETPATEKQIKYLRNLGYEGEIPSKRFASNKINEIKENKT